MKDADIIDLVDSFLSKCPKKIPKLNGICALTVGIDRGSLVGTFIFDYSKKEMLKHYPARYPCNSPIYAEINEKRWTINLATNLSPASTDGKPGDIPEDSRNFPFCCNLCSQLSRKRLTNERVFGNFKSGEGSSEYTFRVVKKIQYGDLLWIKHFTLTDGKITEIPRSENEFKVNSFKVYKCTEHNTYYSVDLHTDTDRSNYHHAKGQNETEFGPKLLESMQEKSGTISVEIVVEEEDIGYMSLMSEDES